MTSERPMASSARPPRTVGLSLAILASGMLFSVLPLLQMMLLLLLRYRFSRIDLAAPGQADGVAPLAVGGDFIGIDSSIVTLQTLMGIVFLGIAVLAWRGRPAWIRFAMLAGYGRAEHRATFRPAQSRAGFRLRRRAASDAAFRASAAQHLRRALRGLVYQSRPRARLLPGLLPGRSARDRILSARPP